MADTVGKLAFDEAKRTIDRQETGLDGLRSRAGVLLSAASLVTAFLGGQALAKPSIANGAVTRPAIGAWGVVAIAAFVGVGLLTVAILWPYNWRFAMETGPILDTKAEAQPMNYEEVQEQLAGYHDKNYRLNQPKIDVLFWVFRLAALLLTLETVAWIFDLEP
jgi:hypothetical protein